MMVWNKLRVKYLAAQDELSNKRIHDLEIP